jgi:hypothetical protein
MPNDDDIPQARSHPSTPIGAEDLAFEMARPPTASRPDANDHDCLDWNSGGACYLCRRPLSIEEQTRTPPTHTPGPWRVRAGSSCQHVVSADGFFSTGCISFDGRSHANAHLIAAAPELLAELKEKICAVECACCTTARAVIAKAAGR